MENRICYSCATVTVVQGRDISVHEAFLGDYAYEAVKKVQMLRFEEELGQLSVN